MGGTGKSNEETLIGQLLDEDKKIENGILQVLNDTRQIGKATLQELKNQGKQLHGAQYGMDEILFQQDQSKRKVRSIKSFFADLFYSIAPCLKRRSDFDNYVARPPASTSSTSNIHNVLGGDIIADSLQDEDNKKKYAESEAMLDEMGKALNDLEKIANSMGDEIRHHNNQLDTLEKTTGQAQDNNDVLDAKVQIMLR